ncbi:MAG: putative glutathione-dependent formaldehyde-activating enzyme [Parcubacteria group bacterium]|nr:putative glutathione-dependent formaldehyde-activating enzyme [Parcubacteria group bacterium]
MEGGCHCGAVRFTATGAPDWVGACYCIDCRKISGSPYTVFAQFKKSDVQIKGTPKEYQSSEKVIRSFCENCSSPFAYSYIDSRDQLFIPVGVFDDASSFAPKNHIFVSQKLPWVIVDTDAPQEK